jgi:biotin/methionine sulfoxide reductase
VTAGLTDWPVIAEHTELIVAFGGISTKNTGVASGGITAHDVPAHLRALDTAGVEIVAIGPLRESVPDVRGARWLPVRPASDVALMLALMHVLFAEGLADRAFLQRYCTGADVLEDYVATTSPEWAAPLCEVPADDIRALARLMATRRTLVTVTWSLQRAEHGEQAPWAGLALAAVLGGIGLPGQGFGHGYGSMGDVGTRGSGTRMPRVPQGTNAVAEYIPVARVADMLLHPGEAFRYDGQTLTYPDIALVYWAGGNPFHHHQDLGRLRRALGRADTVVVHEPFWTAAAKHADIVVPVTTAVERTDIGATPTDRHIVPMHAVVAPLGEARDDYAVFADLAAALGVEAAFTEGRTAQQWLDHLYDGWADATRRRLGVELPDGVAFFAGDVLTLPQLPHDRTFLAAFRADPDAHRLRTPSGRIELYSARIASFGDPDCPGHPSWIEPEEWLGAPAAARFPLHLIAHQPRGRLHSQLDAGAESARNKVAGREGATLHPADAAARGIADGDVVRLFNDRGACLAGARLSDGVRRGVVVLPTGAWFDPLPDGTCAHGNPNVLTRDRGTSSLAQGCTGQHALVEVERFEGEPPPVRAFGPPPFTAR